MKQVEPIKVLQVVGAMNRAGTETMLMNIYRNVDTEKVQFDFISYAKGEADYDQEIKGLGGKVIRLSKTNSVKELYYAMKENGPYDAVHAHTLFHCGIANSAALLAGVKIRIAHAHTTADNSGSITRKMYIAFMRLVINSFSTKLLACSNGAGEFLFGNRSLTKKKYTFFPNVIDYGKFLHAPKREIKQLAVAEGLENSIVIGHVGRFIEAKNHLFLLEIMKCIIKVNPTIKLLLVGEGDLREKIESEAELAELLDNTRFLGLRNDIATIMHSIDIFVFPSIYEGLGLVLLEAQASGVPCIVSKAIQPEADINAGLVTTLSLADGPDYWAEKIIELAAERENYVNNIIEAFERKGYSLTKGISLLMKTYQVDKGETYEKVIDRLL